mmetsp:Transcript_7909/g.17404  ORF Transcript_7909/g.17404 Transcript_7909/m.17404 type:complete len:232 (-) Transcript_7909:1509-2204(-)|eukprot:6197309-Pleurochrysis_carterae.AAC.5
MSTFSFLLLEGGTRDAYPRLRRSRASRRISTITLGVTAAISTGVSLFVGTVCFMRGDTFGQHSLQDRYGDTQCAAGPDMYRSQVVNYSPCCMHLSSTCCDLHSGRSCPSEYEHAMICGRNRSCTSSAHHKLRPAACMEMLRVLSCARCSPYAGHYVRTGDDGVSRTVVCRSYCDQLWQACMPPAATASEAMHSSAGPAELCTRLGLIVAGAEGNAGERKGNESAPDSACFS